LRKRTGEAGGRAGVTKEKKGGEGAHAPPRRRHPPRPHPPAPTIPSPLFVTWDAACPAGGPPRLRGCIGTLDPRPLRAGLREYALTAALRDRRFAAITPGELPSLHCTVSLLTSFEAADGWADWTPGTHGLTIEFEDPASGRARSATYLPAVAREQGWDQVTAVDSLMRKAGYGGPISAALRREVRLTRYQASTATDDFVSLFGGVGDGGDGLRDGLVPGVGGGKWAFA
jgi:uncharacterized protein (TIGR00296 family)